MVRNSLVALALSCATMLVSGPVEATVMERMELEQLVLRADAIVHGTVVRVGTQGAVAGNPRPRTIARVEVREWIAGERPTRHVLIRELGARVGDRVVKLHGAPSYREGDEVVVFLARDGSGFYRTLGMAQGCFFVGDAQDVVVDDDVLKDDVVKDDVAKDGDVRDVARAGVAPAVRRMEDLALARPAADGGRVIEAADAQLPVALPSLLALLRTLSEARP